jgi:hypothetical protein
LPPSGCLLSPLRVPPRVDPSGLGHAATIHSSVQGPPGFRNTDRRSQHRELRQERPINGDEWYNDFHHGNFTFDDASPLAAKLQATPWPPSYKPPQLPMYDEHSDLKQFLMSYEATISSYGGNTTVMAKSFVMAVRSVAQTWYSSLRPGTITSWQKVKDMLVTSF